ncbi:hypothetical protein EJ110_NYTH03973 [Nymphaea thermarum]|nr:hypothetical protein EJ110_NYTH03973 [Nymphaea thermarum]
MILAESSLCFRVDCSILHFPRLFLLHHNRLIATARRRSKKWWGRKKKTGFSRDLSSVELSAREAAVEALVMELPKVQKEYEKSVILIPNEDDDDDDTGSPVFMDALVDTFLCLLPQFSGFSTESGLIRMSRVMKKDLKPSHHQAVTDKDKDDNFIGIEESEDVDQAEDSDGGQSDYFWEDADESADPEVNCVLNVAPLESDSSDGGMDDEAIFRIDSYLNTVSRTRQMLLVVVLLSLNLCFSSCGFSHFWRFFYKNAGKHENQIPSYDVIFLCPLVRVAYPYLVKAFFNSCAAEGSEQLEQRIAGILQKKLFKSKKSLRLSSRSRQKGVATLAQNSSFWILKLLHGNFSPNELSRVSDMLQPLLDDYFNDKKSRLKSGFVKEIFRRYPWTRHRPFGFLLENCTSTNSEYRMTEALALYCVVVSEKTQVDEVASIG